MKTKKKQATCSEDELANRIATEILTVCGVKCSRAAMMKGKYPDGEKYVGGRDNGSIAFVVKEHLLAAGLLCPPATTLSDSPQVRQQTKP